MKERLEDVLLRKIIPGPNPRLNRDDLTISELLHDMQENGQKDRSSYAHTPSYRATSNASTATDVAKLRNCWDGQP
jgi:hypothetical protein